MSWLKVLGSGCAVYLLVAACGAVGAPPGLAGGAGSGGEGGDETAGAGGSGGAGGILDAGIDVLADSTIDAVTDALTDPIPDAVADVISDHEVEGGGESGDRLKVRYYEGTDGSRFPMLQPYDSELKTACSYRQTSDGAWRCVPPTVIASYFSDAGCSQGLAVTSPCGGVEYSATTDACGLGLRIFELGAAVTQAEVFSSSSGECKPLGNPCLVASCAMRSVGAEVAASRFVSGTVVE